MVAFRARPPPVFDTFIWCYKMVLQNACKCPNFVTPCEMNINKTSVYGAFARTHNPKVTGSSPVPATRNR